MKIAGRWGLRISAATGVRVKARVPQARNGPEGEFFGAWQSLRTSAVSFALALYYMNLHGAQFPTPLALAAIRRRAVDPWCAILLVVEFDEGAT